MQHLNDDMDELFRRAAEDYPLKTDSADWNAVAKKLSAGKPPADNEPVKANRNYKHLLWLLLLLPVGWLSYHYMFDNKKSPAAITENISNKNLQAPSLSKKADHTTVTVEPVLPRNSTGLHTKDIQLKAKGKLNAYLTQNTSVSIEQDKIPVVPGNNEIGVFGKKENEVKPEKIEVIAQEEAVSGKTDNRNNIEILNGPLENKSTDNKKEVTVPEILDNNKTTAKNSKNKIAAKDRGLYAGIIISPDISTVKFQSIKNMGIGMGLLIGYQISNKVSVETGVSWDIKNYYSDGKYFNTKGGVYSNPNSKIISVDGVCNMIEIPVNIRYKLTTGKTYFSASAGVSSYIMKKEKYDYIITYNNGQPYPRTSTYYDSSTNFLAVANLGIGYNRTLRHNLTLRIEPYIKIPLKGVGIGSLPIMSSGLNIGITKKLSR